MLMRQTIGTRIIAALGICADVQVCRGNRRQDSARSTAASVMVWRQRMPYSPQQDRFDGAAGRL